MTMNYSFEQAKNSFDLVLKEAALSGKVIIEKNHERYILMPDRSNTSPLNVESVDLKMSSKEILDFIHSSRKS